MTIEQIEKEIYDQLMLCAEVDEHDALYYGTDESRQKFVDCIMKLMPRWVFVEERLPERPRCPVREIPLATTSRKYVQVKTGHTEIINVAAVYHFFDKCWVGQGGVPFKDRGWVAIQWLDNCPNPEPIKKEEQCQVTTK